MFKSMLQTLLFWLLATLALVVIVFTFGAAISMPFAEGLFIKFPKTMESLVTLVCWFLFMAAMIYFERVNAKKQTDAFVYNKKNVVGGRVLAAVILAVRAVSFLQMPELGIPVLAAPYVPFLWLARVVQSPVLSVLLLLALSTWILILVSVKTNKGEIKRFEKKFGRPFSQQKPAHTGELSPVQRARETMQVWQNAPWLHMDLRKEFLRPMLDDEVLSRFGSEMVFGTAGLRGVIGVGTNRLNVHTVGRATQGVADYVKKTHFDEIKRGVIIAYDNRNLSDVFANHTAMVLCANNIPVYLYPTLTPVPMLSFAVRHMNALAGIMITASHNPPKYNGYKVFWADGVQLPLDIADGMMSFIDRVEYGCENIADERDAKRSGLLNNVPQAVVEDYFAAVHAALPDPDIFKNVPEFCAVYTPLHGTGNLPVQRVMEEAGFKNVVPVTPQTVYDGNFSTTESPNPEDPRAFALSKKYGALHNADLLVATDPDSDRVAVMVKDENNEYQPMTGNQLGCLLMDYILSARKEKGMLPQKPAVVKTIVTTNLANRVAKSFGCHVEEVLTGFKFIGEYASLWGQTHEWDFVFGYEESCGFLVGDYGRDKDGVSAALLACACAAHHKAPGKTMFDALADLHQTHGYFAEDAFSIGFEGPHAQELMARMMENLRAGKRQELGGLPILAVRDYLTQTRVDSQGNTSALTLPKSNVLYYELGEDTWVAVRPSGTEPKCKVYISVRGKTKETAHAQLADVSAQMKALTE